MARNDYLARDKNQKKSLLDRRGYLKLAGATAASVATFGTNGAAAQGGDGDIILQEDFENDDYTQWFTSAWDQGEDDYVTSEDAYAGSSSLRIDIPQGEHRGMKAKVDPKDAGLTDQNVQELYASYWIKFDPNFESDSNGGKLPGPRMREPELSAGEGCTGSNGWSALGKFGGGDGGIVVGYYCYHMDMDGRWGDHIHAATVPRGEWVHIEQYVRVNTVSNGTANSDGALKMWVNGERKINRTNMRYTVENRDLGINYDLIAYYGGSATSPRDNHVYIDDWTLSKSRVGGKQREGTKLELVTDSSMIDNQYEFVVEGDAHKLTNEGDLSAEYNDEITANDDGTVTVSGTTGNALGDSYLIDGTIRSMSGFENPGWTIRYDGQETTVEELVEPYVNIDQLDVTKSEQLGDDRMFSVQWAVSNATNGLDTVEVVAAQDSANVNFSVTNASGESASGWDLFQFPVGSSLDVTVRAKDADGNVSKETKSITL
jgi:hypothetical protein